MRNVAAGREAATRINGSTEAVTHLMTSRDGMGARWAVRTFAPQLMRLVLPGSAGGAESILFAATAAAPGSYSGPQGPGEIRGRVGTAKLSRHATDRSLAHRLWASSEELTSVPFDL